MKLSNYSLNYSRPIASGAMTIEDFLAICREQGLEGASLHGRDLPDLRPATLARVRRGLLDQGLSLAQFTVSTNFGVDAERQAGELAKAREAIAAAAFLGAPLLRVFAGFESRGGPGRGVGPRGRGGAAGLCRRRGGGAAGGSSEPQPRRPLRHRGRRAAVRQGGRSPEPDRRARLRPVPRQPGGQRRRGREGRGGRPLREHSPDRSAGAARPGQVLPSPPRRLRAVHRLSPRARHPPKRPLQRLPRHRLRARQGGGRGRSRRPFPGSSATCAGSSATTGPRRQPRPPGPIAMRRSRRGRTCSTAR